jgi:hypothetical protein
MSEKMTIPLGAIFDPQFSATLMSLSQSKLPAKTAYWVSRVFKVCAEAEKSANEARMKVFQEHGKKVDPEDPNSGWTLEGSEAKDAALTELNELQQQPLELPITKKIVLPESFEITPVQLQAVETVITVEGIDE